MDVQHLLESLLTLPVSQCISQNAWAAFWPMRTNFMKCQCCYLGGSKTRWHCLCLRNESSLKRICLKLLNQMKEVLSQLYTPLHRVVEIGSWYLYKLLHPTVNIIAFACPRYLAGKPAIHNSQYWRKCEETFCNTKPCDVQIREETIRHRHYTASYTH